MGLEDFTDDPIEVKAGGRTVEVRAIRVRHTKAFMAALQPLWKYVLAMQDGEIAVDPLMTMVLHETTEAVALVKAATGLDDDFLGDLDNAELARLVAAVLKANLDFFALRLLPTTGEARKTVAAAFAGMMPSPTSPDEGTA